MIALSEITLASPWWLLTALLIVPATWMALRSLKTFGRARRWTVILLRAFGLALLAVLLARPTVTDKADGITVIVVRDRSRSISDSLQNEGLEQVARAATARKPADRIAAVDVAEDAYIVRLPSADPDLPKRNTTLLGEVSRLADGVELAMAVAPPDSGTRVLLVSDGNETAGDLREAARVAAANGIPIDVLPRRYHYDREVALRRLVAPARARLGQSVRLRCILRSTHAAKGQVVLRQGNTVVTTIPVALSPGTNVASATVRVSTSGVHEYAAEFVPDQPNDDGLAQNNRASAVTFVAGQGKVIVLEGAADAGRPLAQALRDAHIEVDRRLANEAPRNLAQLLGADAVVLVNVENSLLTRQQQQLLSRYVTEMGGGLVMVGGPLSYGAGGWIGSPMAKVLPVDMDPPQKRVMLRGALVLVMHACEMPRGNYWSKQTAIAAVNALSRMDLVGVVEYSYASNTPASWVYPLSPVGDRRRVLAAINKMSLGDMPDFQAPLQAAYNSLKGVQAAQKHIIVISDGDPAAPSTSLLKQMRAARISVSGVVVSPHSPSDLRTLKLVADYTGGRFHFVRNAQNLPQIFIKEAKQVRRGLIVEEPFTPRIADGSSPVIRGLTGGLQPLQGYVRTGDAGGLSRTVLRSHEGDPILATGQFGLGRSVAFTSDAEPRWAAKWIPWGGYNRFWEQVVRWAARPTQDPSLDILTDVQARDVTVTVRATDPEGNPMEFARIVGQTIAPDANMTVRPLSLTQVGSGEYRATFRAVEAGSHLVHLRYVHEKTGKTGAAQVVVNVPYAPEYEDLTDNLALLSEIAHTTGGTVWPAEADTTADMFARRNVRLPGDSRPFNIPLLIAWVAVFLLDVAVRRLVIHLQPVADAARWVLARFRRGRTSDATVARLQARRRKVHGALYADVAGDDEPSPSQPGGPTQIPTPPADSERASRRYTGGTAGDVDPSAAPQVGAGAEEPPRQAEPSQQPSAPSPEIPEDANDTMSRLLQRKRRGRDR